MPENIEFGELYVRGARVWIKDPELVWKGCKLGQDLTPDLEKIALIPDDESPNSGMTHTVRIKGKYKSL